MNEAETYNEKGETNYQASKKGVIALGLYLVLMMILGLVMLVILMTAETDPGKIKADEAASACALCNSNANNSANANGPAQNSNVNANAETNNPANANSPAAPTAVTNTARPNTNVNTRTNAGANTKANTPANSTAANNKENSNVKPPPTASPTPREQEFPELDVPAKVKVWLFSSPITADSFLVLIVLFAGMLGAIIRGVFSFSKHLGLGDFSFKWTWFYLLLPFSGASLSIILYLVIRGGFYSSSYGKGLVLNIFSFAALAALTGLFTENAMEKLRQVATVILSDTTPKVPNAREVVDQQKKDKENL